MWQFCLHHRVHPQPKCFRMRFLRISSAWPSFSSVLCSKPSGCSTGAANSAAQASNPDCRKALWRTQQANRMAELLSGEYCRQADDSTLFAGMKINYTDGNKQDEALKKHPKPDATPDWAEYEFDKLLSIFQANQPIIYLFFNIALEWKAGKAASCK